MILYFTGTGNSKYAAEYVGSKINEGCVNLFERLKNCDYSELNSLTPFVICTPTYAWQIPHILRNWLLRANLSGSRDIYFVMTCGGEIGNAEKYLKELCQKINMNYMGCAEIVMPENYIAMFDSPTLEQEDEIMQKADIKLKSVAQQIANKKRLPENRASVTGKISSSVVNDLFYPLFVKDKKFTAGSNCTGCGLCQKNCVLNNIKITDGKPQWLGNCTHCMACINYCPTGAIEYGAHSKGLRRYKCRNFMDNTAE